MESTIVDLSRGEPVLLRPGAVTREAIGRVLGVAPRDRDAAAPRHRARWRRTTRPAPSVALVAATDLERRVRRELAAGRRSPCWREAWPGPLREAAAVWWHVAPEAAAAYGHDSTPNLRALDANGAGLIVDEAPPEGAAWEAVRDRLSPRRAGADDSDET